MDEELLCIAIKINLDYFPEDSDFSFRYILTDTTEARDIGEVVDEGSGNGFMDITVEVKNINDASEKIKEILNSLNILNYELTTNSDD
jgi:hypothetical protein